MSTRHTPHPLLSVANALNQVSVCCRRLWCLQWENETGSQSQGLESMVFLLLLGGELNPVHSQAGRPLVLHCLRVDRCYLKSLLTDAIWVSLDTDGKHPKV